MSEQAEKGIIEFVPNPANAGRPITDTELLQNAMDRMKIIADENSLLRKAITAVSNAPEEDFTEALANAVDIASGPLPYSLSDFLPALRNIYD